jgi:signal peptidase I
VGAVPPIAVAIAAVAGLVLLRRRYVVVSVVGTSMEPTLREGQRVLVRRTTLGRITSGQLVVFALISPVPGAGPLPGDPPWMIKRAVALPGDPVPPEAAPAAGAGADDRVPAGRLVVLGDNSRASFDSRRAGYVDGATLLGVVRRVLPG